jgi:hypothetical protein
MFDFFEDEGRKITLFFLILEEIRKFKYANERSNSTFSNTLEVKEQLLMFYILYCISFTVHAVFREQKKEVLFIYQTTELFLN